ncbi:MAG: sugar transferase, partial [Bacteroidetes bacterium]|nr:sugar transferase [Bacteroidota bacterium]
YSDEIKNRIYNTRPGITGIGSLIFRDEEKIISEAPNARAMYDAIYPYKGQLELWYLSHQSTLTDLKIIFLTAWSIIFPENNLSQRFFSTLPKRSF